MLRILVAVDGSEHSDRTVSHVLKQVPLYKDAVEIHLLNVQPPLPAKVARFAPASQVQEYHREHGEESLASARKILDGSGTKYLTHIGVGEPAPVIEGYVRDQGIDLVAMGSRGLGSVTGLLLGSVATKVIGSTTVPVLVVK